MASSCSLRLFVVTLLLHCHLFAGDANDEYEACAEAADIEAPEMDALRMSLLQHPSRGTGRKVLQAKPAKAPPPYVNTTNSLNESIAYGPPNVVCESSTRGGPAGSPCEDALAAAVAAAPGGPGMAWRKLKGELAVSPRMAWRKLKGGHQIPDVEGPSVDAVDAAGNKVWVSAWACTGHCGQQDNCNYVIVCGGSCYLRAKTIPDPVHEPTHRNNYCDAYVYTDVSYQPADEALLQPSGAEKFTFYMYRSQGPSHNGDYPLQNVNTATIGGAMWYLHNEVVKDCYYGGKAGARRFQITRLRRFKVSMRATKPLRDKGLNFGVLKSFDSGEATGPHRYEAWSGKGSGWNSQAEWDQYGFHVGCGILGQFPHTEKEFKSGARYPDPVWYSLPGECPEVNYQRRTSECAAENPGGMCKDPTGAGNCTFAVEDAGEIDIDELVGITPKFHDRAAYCSKGCKEGDPKVEKCFGEFQAYDPNPLCGSFWDNIWDPVRNELRVQKALDAFRKKYPESTPHEDMLPPVCDFSQSKYGWWR